MSRTDAPRAEDLRAALVEGLRSSGSPLSDDELFAFATGTLGSEEQAAVRERLVHSAADRERFREIRQFVLAEAQLAPAVDPQAEAAASPVADPEVEADWSDFLEQAEAHDTTADGVDRITDAKGPEHDLDTTPGAPSPPPRPWLRVVAPALVAMGVVVALTFGPDRDPGVGWDPDVAASQGTVVFEQRGGPAQRIAVAEGERLQLEVFHPALPTDCAEVDLQVRRSDGASLPVSEAERVEGWLRFEISEVEAGRHTVELAGCGVDAVTDVEIVRPEGR